MYYRRAWSGQSKNGHPYSKSNPNPNLNQTQVCWEIPLGKARRKAYVRVSPDLEQDTRLGGDVIVHLRPSKANQQDGIRMCRDRGSFQCSQLRVDGMSLGC